MVNLSGRRGTRGPRATWSYDLGSSLKSPIFGSLSTENTRKERSPLSGHGPPHTLTPSVVETEDTVAPVAVGGRGPVVVVVELETSEGGRVTTARPEKGRVAAEEPGADGVEQDEAKGSGIRKGETVVGMVSKGVEEDVRPVVDGTVVETVEGRFRRGPPSTNRSGQGVRGESLGRFLGQGKDNESRLSTHRPGRGDTEGGVRGLQT